MSDQTVLLYWDENSEWGVSGCLVLLHRATSFYKMKTIATSAEQCRILLFFCFLRKIFLQVGRETAPLKEDILTNAGIELDPRG